MDNSTLLEKVKMAVRITSDAYDSELTDLIEAAIIDLGIAGVVVPEEIDAIVNRAICTYCKMNFGVVDNYAYLKESYDEQKAQLVTATGYTNWELIPTPEGDQTGFLMFSDGGEGDV